MRELKHFLHLDSPAKKWSYRPSPPPLAACTCIRKTTMQFSPRSPFLSPLLEQDFYFMEAREFQEKPTPLYLFPAHLTSDENATENLCRTALGSREGERGVKSRFGGERLYKSQEELHHHLFRPSVMFRELRWSNIVRADQASCTQLLFHVRSIPITLLLQLQL